MNTLILFRFDIQPNQQVSALLATHVEGRPHALQIPGAVITLMHTFSSLEEIDNDLQSLSHINEKNDEAPICYILNDITRAPYSVRLPHPSDGVLQQFLNKHTTHRRSAQLSSQSIDDLQRILGDALKNEDYELAARTRDQIKSLK